MKLEYEKKFKKELKKINQPKDKKNIDKALKALMAVPHVGELFNTPNVKKLIGYDKYWRIRAGDFRIGFVVEDDIIYIERIGHRGQFYDYYPEMFDPIEASGSQMI